MRSVQNPLESALSVFPLPLRDDHADFSPTLLNSFLQLRIGLLSRAIYPPSPITLFRIAFPNLAASIQRGAFHPLCPQLWLQLFRPLQVAVGIEVGANQFHSVHRITPPSHGHASCFETSSRRTAPPLCGLPSAFPSAAP